MNQKAFLFFSALHSAIFIQPICYAWVDPATRLEVCVDYPTHVERHTMRASVIAGRVIIGEKGDLTFRTLATLWTWPLEAIAAAFNSWLSPLRSSSSFHEEELSVNQLHNEGTSTVIRFTPELWQHLKKIRWNRWYGRSELIELPELPFSNSFPYRRISQTLLHSQRRYQHYLVRDLLTSPKEKREKEQALKKERDVLAMKEGKKEFKILGEVKKINYLKLKLTRRAKEWRATHADFFPQDFSLWRQLSQTMYASPLFLSFSKIFTDAFPMVKKTTKVIHRLKEAPLARKHSICSHKRHFLSLHLLLQHPSLLGSIGRAYSFFPLFLLGYDEYILEIFNQKIPFFLGKCIKACLGKFNGQESIIHILHGYYQSSSFFNIINNAFAQLSIILDHSSFTRFMKEGHFLVNANNAFNAPLTLYLDTLATLYRQLLLNKIDEDICERELKEAGVNISPALLSYLLSLLIESKDRQYFFTMRISHYIELDYIENFSTSQFPFSSSRDLLLTDSHLTELLLALYKIEAAIYRKNYPAFKELKIREIHKEHLEEDLPNFTFLTNQLIESPNFDKKKWLSSLEPDNRYTEETKRTLLRLLIKFKMFSMKDLEELESLKIKNNIKQNTLIELLIDLLTGRDSFRRIGFFLG